MARLEYEIVGNSASLKKAASEGSASLRQLETAAEKTNKAIRNEITPIGDLQKAVVSLNKNKINIADAEQLGRQNRLIKELKADIDRLNNAGTAGFDAFGNKIQSANQGLLSMGASLTKGLSGLRTLAYILPGLGIAGIFNLGFEAIAKAADGLGLFNDRAAKTKEAKKNLDEYVESLSAASRASVQAAGNYGQEVAKLDILFSSIQKNTNARYGEKSAIEEIQSTYPQYFGNLEKSEFLTNKATKAYENARTAIISMAVAQGSFGQIAKLGEEISKASVAIAATEAKIVNLRSEEANIVSKMKNDVNQAASVFNANRLAEITNEIKAQQKSISDYKVTQAGLNTEVKQFQKVAADAIAKFNDATPKKTGIIYSLEKQLKELQDKRQTITVQAELDLNTKQIKDLQDRLDKLGGLKGTKKASAGTGSSVNTITDQIRNLSQRTGNSASLAGLEGYTEQIQKVKNTYTDLFADINSLEADLTKNTKLSAKERADATANIAKLRKEATKNQIAELSALEVTEAQRVANEIQRINNESGVKSAESKAKEFAAIEKWYDAEVVKAKGNADILATIEAGKLAQVEAVNAKYEQKATDLWFKISQLEDQAAATTGDKDEKITARIKKEWDERKKKAVEYFDLLIKIAEADPNLTAAQKIVQTRDLGKKRDSVLGNLEQGKSNDTAAKLATDFERQMKRAIRNLSDNFLDTLLNFNQETDRSLLNLAAKLGDSVSKSIDNAFKDQFSNTLQEVLKNGISSGAEEGGAKLKDVITASVGLLGSALQGLTSKTDVAGQTAGGTLKGAATGFATAGPIGAVVGGVIGGVSGLFGSKKARKEEENRLKEIEAEQKRQTELMRQNALAYTSSIIGKMTEQGIVTAVEVNEFGQLTAKVSGKDLQFVLDRNAQSR